MNITNLLVTCWLLLFLSMSGLMAQSYAGQIKATNDTIIARGQQPKIYNVLMNDYQWTYKVNKLTIVKEGRGTTEVKRTNGVDKIVYTSKDKEVDAFTYQICSRYNKCVTAVVTVMKCEPKVIRFPKVKTKYIEVNEKIEFNYPGQYLTFHKWPEHGELEIIDKGKAIYTPKEGFTGQERINFSVYEDQGYCGQIYQKGINNIIYILPTEADNQPPVAVADNFLISKRRKTKLDVLANDYDPDGTLDRSIQIIRRPANGKIKCCRGALSYTPKKGFVGTDKMTYEVCDLNGDCATGTVTIEVKTDGTTTEETEVIEETQEDNEQDGSTEEQ